MYYKDWIYCNTLVRTAYYIVGVKISPGWKLPHPRSIKVETGRITGWAGRQDADTSQWKEPPHVVMANLGYQSIRPSAVASDDDVRRFTERYGMDLRLRDLPVSENTAPLVLDEFRNSQKELREAWERRDHRIFTDPNGEARDQGWGWFPADLKVRGRRLELHPADVWTFMQILLARDIATGCAKVCRNPDCPAPYFIAQRNDAKYCSHSCAVAVNVRNFRQRRRKRNKR